MADSKKTTVVFTWAEYNEKTKSYSKKWARLNFYEFSDLSLKLFAKSEDKKIGTLTLDWTWYTIWENEWEYGKYRSGTIQKDELYFSVKKWLARIWQQAPIEVTFREIVTWEINDVKAVDWSEDEDLLF